jgi:hypothetical protein
MWLFSQPSPVAIEQSCMSLHRFGITKETVGNVEKSLVGNALKGSSLLCGKLVKLVQGACLRAYFADVQPVKPTDGRSSE